MSVEQKNLIFGRKTNGLLAPILVDSDGKILLSGDGDGNIAPTPENSLELTLNLRSVDVPTPGTSVQLINTQTLVYSFYVQAKPANLGNVYIGLSTVDKDNEDTQFMQLAAGYGQGRTALPGAVLDLSDYYLDADNADEGIVIEYWTD